jgi:hypothetical protein
LGNFKNYIKHSKADVVGIIASSICIIHCVLTPFIVIVFSEVIKEKYELLNYFFLLISLVSVVLSVKSSKDKLIKGLLIYFWIQLSLGLFFEDKNIIFSILMYFSAIGLIGTHVLNIKYCKTCKH